MLIMSPDTDVYNIGIALHHTEHKQLIVQLNAYSARQLRLLSMSNFIKALSTDPDLAHVQCQHLAQILQTLYVTTGCDYICGWF